MSLICYDSMLLSGTPPLDTTTTFISFPGPTQVNRGGHELVVTISPTEPGFPLQTVQRRFRVGNGSFKFWIIFG